MADVVRWVDTQDEEQVRWALERARRRSRRSTRSRRSRCGTTRTRVERLRDRRDRAHRLRRPGRPRLGDDAEISAPSGSSTAAATPPTSARPRTSSAASSRSSRRSSRRSSPHAYERATETGKPLDPPLLLVLDECANIAPLRDLATLASTGAGQGIQLVSVFQDMAQINAVYGRDRAPTIVSNHRAKVILSGIADAADARLRRAAARRRGSAAALVDQRRRRPALDDRVGRLPDASRRRTSCARCGPATGCSSTATSPPARIALRPWFKDRGFASSRATGPRGGALT